MDKFVVGVFVDLHRPARPPLPLVVILISSSDKDTFASSERLRTCSARLSLERELPANLVGITLLAR